MDNKQLIKGALIFGGGFLLFALLRPKDKSKSESSSPIKKLEGDNKLVPAPSPENAEIVLVLHYLQHNKVCVHTLPGAMMNHSPFQYIHVSPL